MKNEQSPDQPAQVTRARGDEEWECFYVDGKNVCENSSLDFYELAMHLKGRPCVLARSLCVKQEWLDGLGRFPDDEDSIPVDMILVDHFFRGEIEIAR